MRILVVELGSEGGFILGSGGEMPPDTKPENAQAMFDSVRLYGNLSSGRSRLAPAGAHPCKLHEHRPGGRWRKEIIAT